MKVLLCGRYEMEIRDSLLKGQGGPHDPFFVHLLNPKRRAELSRFTWCWEKLVQEVKKRAGRDSVRSVTEYFGGMGRSAVIIQKELKPERHAVVDIDESQYQHLTSLRSVYPTLRAYRDDAYGIAGGHPADFVALDLPFFTLLKLLNEPPFSGIIERATAGQPRFLEVADGALSRLHMNKKVYSEAAGCEINTPEDYFRALSRGFQQKFDYGISFVAHYGKLSALLLQPDYAGEIDVLDARSAPESKDYLAVLEE